MGRNMSNFKTKLCKDFMQNRPEEACSQKEHCQSAHGEWDLQLRTAPPLDSYKKKVCLAYERTNFCPLGAACWDIHDAAELTAGLCPLYRATRRCYFPSSCPFESHLFASLAAPYVPNRSRHWRSLDKPPASPQPQPQP